MGWWLASPRDGDRLRADGAGWIKRFDPRYWTMNFPRSMMAAATTTDADALRVDAVFYRADDLAGLIWEAEDRFDHPLARYETARDFRQCVLRFRWASQGIMPLDAINGPTLTIEGRDAAGTPRSWYVRLWNYSVGTPQDAIVTLDFAALVGGFRLPEDADPVWAGDIDRLFLSLVPPGYSGEATPLPAPAEAWVALSELRCEGAGSTLEVGEVLVPAHRLRIATGYDDGYNLTPARMIEQAVALGYRHVINHYVGMSHYFRLGWDAGAGRFLLSAAGGVLNVACRAWHADFLARAKAAGFEVILSLSYELFDEHCFEDWKQRDADGRPALTGWQPPSTLLSPAHDGAMGYLRAVAGALVALATEAGQPVRFQIGEPWWWLVPGTGRLCIYDDAARAALARDLGGEPPRIADVRGPRSPAEIALLDRAGALLAASTVALADAVRAAAAAGGHGAELLILVYLPTVLDPAAPELRRANVPAGWAAPAFDVLQLEDYDWTIAGDEGGTARGQAAMTARLGYPLGQQHYFSGFVLRPEDRMLWQPIDRAAEAGCKRGTAEVFVWALPQVLRDGYVHWDEEDADVQAFDDVSFPLAVGRGASAAPAFSTAVVTTASGNEQRNADWADALLSFDAGPGVRSDADMAALIGFFRARRGAARGFRFRDPFDDSSAGMTGAPGPGDQPIGVGDGIATRFPLTKHYGDGAEPQMRRITRPVAGSVRVAADAAERFDWTLDPGGVIAFDRAPEPGARITAGYRFDVPVRFAEDRLEVSRADHLAGEAPSVPLIEIREG